MTSRRLTAREDAYVQDLCRQQLHIAAQVKALQALPLRDPEPETGLPVWLLLVMLMDAAGYVANDLCAALGGEA